MTVDDVDALSESTPEDTPSPFAAEAADARMDSRAAEQEAARWFLIAAALIALTDIVIAAYFTHAPPNALVAAALGIALVGIVADFANGPRRAVSMRSDFLAR